MELLSLDQYIKFAPSHNTKPKKKLDTNTQTEADIQTSL